MENKEIEVIEIDDKKYAIIIESNEYVYCSNIDNKDDIEIFKKAIINNEEFFEKINDSEKNRALIKFYEDNKEVIEELNF